jgi:hypothetical protein
MKKAIIAICTVIGLLELFVIIAYFRIFNGEISTVNQDWDTFIQIFNGLVMAILTAVNIYIFYQLTVAIEDKNQERIIKQKISDAQTIITQMRLGEYERVKSLINDIIKDIRCKIINEQRLFSLIKELESISSSLLFKNGKISEQGVLNDPTNNILSLTKNVATLSSNEKLREELIAALKTYILIMEIYIVGQLVSSEDIEKYIRKRMDTPEIDCTISCITELFEIKEKQTF